MRAASRAAPLLVVCAAMAIAAGAQTKTPGQAPLTLGSMVGRDLFDFYCASCHGRDGKGSGPVAAALKRPPPDITRLAVEHGGVFPRQRVERYVTNDSDRPLAAAHGTSDMPVWGPVFRGLDPSDTLVRIRIANVVGYVETLQEKP